MNTAIATKPDEAVTTPSVTAEDIVLVIRAAPDVPYADVVRAHDAAAGAGISKVGLMDTPP